MIDPTVIVAALSAAEGLINDVIYHDPVAHAQLNELEGKWLKVHLQDQDMSLYVGVEEQKILLQAALGFDADTEISASWADVQQLLAAKDKQAEIGRLDISVKGSTQLLMSYAKLFENLDVDWEGFFSAKFGNTLGTFVGGSLRKLVSFAESSRVKAKGDVKEWLHHESNLLPFSSDIASFKERIKSLRYQLDRLEAKARRIEIHTKEDL